MKTHRYYQWTIWMMMATAFMMSLFQRGALASISAQVVEELSLNAMQLSNIAGSTYYTYAFMQIPAGLLLDRFGYKKISVLGIACTGLGSILFGCSHQLLTLYLARILIGAGTSVIFISVLKAQRNWFQPKEFIKLSGLLSFLGSLGAILSTFPLAMLATLTGWRMGMVFIGLLCLLLSVAMQRVLIESPTALGYPVQNEEIIQQTKFLTSLKNCIFDPSLIRNFFVLFGTTGATTALTGLWGVPYLTNVYQISATQASFYMAFVLYGLLVGALSINYIASFFQDRLYLIPRYALLGSFILWFVILSVFQGEPPLFLLAIFFFLLGLFATSHLIAFVDLSDPIKRNANGLANSIINSGEFLGSSILSFAIGWMLDATYVGTTINGLRIYDKQQFEIAFGVFALVAMLGVLMTFLRTHETGKDQAIEIDRTKK